jgi:hypothetical protein
MKCRLCGQPPAGPDGLCGDCTRALMRAREGSAALRDPRPSAASGRRANRINLTAPVDSAPAPAKPTRSRLRIVAWAALTVFVVAVVALGPVELTPRRARGAVAADRAPRTAAAAQRDVDAAADGEAIDMEALPALVPGGVGDAGVSPAAPEGTLPVPARPHTTRSPGNGRPAAGSAAAAHRATSDARIGASPGGAGASPEASAQLAQVSIAPSAPPQDDGPSLAAALEKCSGEKFLAGVICEQKVRLRYCEGKWGKVPQCTPRPHAD